METWCWWCCHPFKGPAIHAPYRYDDRRQHFDTLGNFCSWECAKAYLIDQGDSRSGERQMYLALMKRHAVKKYTPIRSAPKRILLDVFGGPLSIEEFRSGSSNVQVFMPYETHRMPILVASHAVPSKKTSDEPGELVLKRPKPLARAKSTLETSLGITRKAK